MVIRVGVTSGIYMAARSPELAGPVKKLGYMITRGADCMELALDVAHEVTYTDGKEIRHIAKKQAIDLFAHGDLAVPIGVPERNDWRDAFDRIKKSIRSAVFIGAKYIDFHASLNVWLELLTYTSHKMSVSFVDHSGRFISEILLEEPRLRKWFMEKRVKTEEYVRDILTKKDKEKRDEILGKELKEAYGKLGPVSESLENLRNKLRNREVTPEEQPKLIKEMEELEEKKNSLEREVQEIRSNEHHMEVLYDVIEKKLANKNPKERYWDNEDLRISGGVLEGHIIMAHYLFYRKDKMWMKMAEYYKDMLARYKINYEDDDWLDDAWFEAERHHDKDFKEFFYAVVTAKYLEGMMEKVFEWINGDFIKKIIPEFAKHSEDPETEIAELTEIAKKLIIALENPDARDAEHAGMHLLWRPKQIYAAVVVIRQTLKTDKVMMIMDHEHLAYQGVDALIESRETVKLIPDLGELILTVHSNHPNAMHSHDPIELGDTLLYELLWNLRKTGFGKKRDVYLIFERGGGDDPFQRSVDALRITARYLEKNIEPKNLPAEFFGLHEMVGNIDRQRMIIMDHKMDPIKDLLEMSEEDWGMLSKVAREKGKAESFKKGEFR